MYFYLQEKSQDLLTKNDAEIVELYIKLYLMQETNDKFVTEKTSGSAASKREQILKDLAAAYDVYTELTSNLNEGTKVNLIVFYFS